MKYLTEEQIKKELNDYIYNVNIKYATLLNGAWGSGKTYFIKKFINELEKKYLKDKKNKKPIYISLYGLSSISEIKNKILLSLIKKESVKKILPFFNLGLEIGSDLVESKTFIQKSNHKLEKIIEAFFKIDNLIIFFDDLERCNININSILGYINELVEHNNAKVIIVADENKIGKTNYQNNLELKYLIALSNNFKIENKNEKSNNSLFSQDINDTKLQFTKDDIIERSKYICSEDSIYSEIKEKLIGKIIYYRSNINNIYDKFSDDIIKDSDARNTAKNNKEKFLKLIEEEKYYNLRTVQFIFQTFDRLATETLNIIEINDIKNIYLNDLFYYCAVKLLQIKQGENSYNWEANQEFGTIYLGNELRNYIYKNFVVGFRFVDDYLDSSYIDKEKLKIVLNDYKKMIINEIENPNDPLYKLNNWYIKSENELKLIIDQLIVKITNNDYDLDLYSKIVNCLSHIEEMDICKSKIKNAIFLLEENIKKGIVKGKYSEDRIYDGSLKTSEIYNKNIKNIKRLIAEMEESNDISYINNMFLKDDWGRQLKDYCDANISKFLDNKSFANILNINQIILNIKNKDIEQIYEFWYGLQKIYDFSNLKDYYSNDKKILTEFKNKLCTLKKIDKVKLFVVNKIIVFLDDIIEKL